MNQITTAWWKVRLNMAIVVFVAVGAYFLWAEHQAHVIEILPWALILLCLGIHGLMHGGHGHGGDKTESKQDDGTNDR